MCLYVSSFDVRDVCVVFVLVCVNARVACMCDPVFFYILMCCILLPNTYRISVFCWIAVARVCVCARVRCVMFLTVWSACVVCLSLRVCMRVCLIVVVG